MIKVEKNKKYILFDEKKQTLSYLSDYFLKILTKKEPMKSKTLHDLKAVLLGCFLLHIVCAKSTERPSRPKRTLYALAALAKTSAFSVDHEKNCYCCRTYGEKKKKSYE
jgi:hypothetical protein